MSTFRVTVKPEGIEPRTVTVQAPDEWKARTRAMLAMPRTLKLNGQHVDYEVDRIEEGTR